MARLTEARRSLAGWLPLVDRLPPAELLDRVLAEAAYTRELSGPGLAQARENLKKIRGLVRRIQNRGYATIERLVEHFSQLVSGGDESNAIIDAVDAVNLMTVHAAKGLEFPVVFVVNLGRGSGGGRDPIRVAIGAASGEEQGEPMVAIGEHESEADEDADAREARGDQAAAVCRADARARSPLSVRHVARSGQVRADEGIAREAAAAIAAGGAGDIERPRRGAVDRAHRAAHHPRGAAGRGSMPASGLARRRPRPRLAHDFAPLAPDGVPRVSTTVVETPAPRRLAARTADRSSSLLGTLVHRLLAYAQQRDERDPGELARVARQFIEGGHEIEDAGDIVRRAVSLSLGVLSRPELMSLPEGAQMVFEVAYSRRLPGGAVERGAIDCLSSPTKAPPCWSSRPGRRATSIGISWPHTSRRWAGTTPAGVSKGASFTWVRGRRAEFRPDLPKLLCRDSPIPYNPCRY